MNLTPWANLWPQLFICSTLFSFKHASDMNDSDTVYLTLTVVVNTGLLWMCSFCPLSHCIIFAWTQQWCYSFWNWEDEFGRVSWPTAELSLYNPWFVLTKSLWQTLSHNKCFFYGVLMCSTTNNPSKYLCAHTNWIEFLDRGVYTIYCLHSVYSKVNRAMSRTYWTWLAGTITMRCPYNGRSPIPDLPIYLAVLMSAY